MLANCRFRTVLATHCERNLQLRGRMVHDVLVNLCIVLASLEFDLGPYVVLEIVDWLPHLTHVDHKQKIDLLFQCRQSIERVRNARTVGVCNDNNNDDDNADTI